MFRIYKVKKDVEIDSNRQKIKIEYECITLILQYFKLYFLTFDFTSFNIIILIMIIE